MILDDIKNRLSSLGFDTSERDEITINFCATKAETIIKAKINRTVVPEELYYIQIDMAAGLYLADKKQTVLSDENSAYFSASVKSITEGDTSITFSAGSEGTSSPEARFDALVKSLTEPSESVFAAFRRLKW